MIYFSPPKFISIHAPRKGERHQCVLLIKLLQKYFNPRSPQGGATALRTWFLVSKPFQSTLPARGSDSRNASANVSALSFQSTLPARGSDPLANAQRTISFYFNPRSPQGGATLAVGRVAGHLCISIHAPRKGERHDHQVSGRAAVLISIHAPRKGERQRKSAFVCSISANLLNIIHCGTVTRAVSRRRIALFRLFSVRRSGVFMYAYASH